MQTSTRPSQDDCGFNFDAKIPASDNSQSGTALQLPETEITLQSALADPKQDTALQSAPQLSDKSSKYRTVKIETADDLLTEIRWCINNGGEYIHYYEPVTLFQSGCRIYYLQHQQYRQGRRRVKGALVQELFDRKALWTDDPGTGVPGKAPGTAYRRFYPVALEITPQSAIAEPEQDTVLQSAPQLSNQPVPKPGETYEPSGSGITKNFVKPGENPKPPYGNRIVEIETSDDLLAEIRWCLDNGGDFVFLFEPAAHGHLPPRRAYYLRHSEWYWEGMRPVKTALVRELIDRRAIWTNDPAKGPGSGCRRFYPTSTPESPEWMTAKQAFEFLGGDPGDRDSSVSLADGSKQIKFSTFKSKTSSELKSFGLELNQDRKRRRQPCYRLLNPK